MNKNGNEEMNRSRKKTLVYSSLIESHHQRITVRKKCNSKDKIKKKFFCWKRPSKYKANSTKHRQIVGQ